MIRLTWNCVQCCGGVSDEHTQTHTHTDTHTHRYIYIYVYIYIYIYISINIRELTTQNQGLMSLVFLASWVRGCGLRNCRVLHHPECFPTPLSAALGPGTRARDRPQPLSVHPRTPNPEEQSSKTRAALRKQTPKPKPLNSQPVTLVPAWILNAIPNNIEAAVDSLHEEG